MKLPQNNVVSVNWLAENLGHKNLQVLYTHMANPVTGENVQPTGYIPGSIFFDLEHDFSDKHSTLPHTMPSEADFQYHARGLGLNSDCTIVVYDDKGFYCAPRVWWMFKSMGHKNVFVLDGGFPEWKAKNLPLQACVSKVSNEGDFNACFNTSSLFSAEQIMTNAGKINVIDARSEERFYGRAPEPRKGLRSGHIPGAMNIPFDYCLNGTFLRDIDELSMLFSALPILENEPMVFSCGSGVTACILALAASELGYDNLVIYDGSWSEWGARTEWPNECF